MSFTSSQMADPLSTSSALAVNLVRRTGQTHAQVNSELNRLSGVGRITEATVGQLRRRLEVAEQVIAAQKKLCMLLGLPSAPEDESSP